MVPADVGKDLLPSPGPADLLGGPALLDATLAELEAGLGVTPATTGARAPRDSFGVPPALTFACLLVAAPRGNLEDLGAGEGPGAGRGCLLGRRPQVRRSAAPLAAQRDPGGGGTEELHARVAVDADGDDDFVRQRTNAPGGAARQGRARLAPASALVAGTERSDFARGRSLVSQPIR